MSSFCGQNKLNITWRLFQGLEQGIGGDVVHALGRKYQDGFTSATCICTLRKFNGISHGLDANFFAGFACLVVDFRLGFFAQWPAQL